MMNNFDEIMATKHNQFANLYYMVHGLLHKSGLDYMHISVIIKTEPYPNAWVQRTNKSTNSITFTTGLLENSSFKYVRACASHEVGHLVTFQQNKLVVPKLHRLQDGMRAETVKDQDFKHSFTKSEWNTINAIKWLFLFFDFVAYTLAWEYNFSNLANDISNFDGIICIFLIFFVIYDNYFTWLYFCYNRKVESKADIIGSHLTSPQAVSDDLINIYNVTNKMNKAFGNKPVSKIKIMLGLLDHPTTKTRIRRIAKANH